MKHRHVFKVELERNCMDSREESFKKISHTGTGNVIKKDNLEEILDKLASDDLEILNDRKASLGVLKVPSGSYYLKMKSKKDVEDPNQLCLFQTPDLDKQCFKTGQDYQHIPYVVIPSQRKQKNIQIRDWGTYILLGKKHGVISDAYLSGIFKENDVYFIVGNMNGCRNVWIVCSFYTYPPVRQQGLFSLAA